MERAAWTVDDEPTVGVVDPAADSSDGGAAAGDGIDDTLAGLERAQDDRPFRVVRGDATTVLSSDPSLLVTIGERSLSALVRRPRLPDVPALPVDAGRAVGSVRASALEAAIGSILEGDATRRENPVLAVEGDEIGRERALFDVTLVTDEPARISEYAVHSRGETVERFRADGVVVATPVGSRGYARAVQGPLVSPAIDGVVAAPIAPFATRPDRWLLPDDDLRCSVERDEGDVALCVDDVTVGTVPPERSVSIAAERTLSTLEVPQSRAFFGDDDETRPE